MTFLRSSGLLIVLASALSSCVVPDDLSHLTGEHATATAARSEMLGLTKTQVRMCAGFPNDTVDVGDDGEIWSFRTPNQRGNMNVALPAATYGALPAIGGSFNLAPGGFCHTQVRLVNDVVTEVEFSGDNNRPSSRNALCTSLIDSCVVYARRNR
ncbi:hypothetical protein [Aliihoeflea sp. PC F10.4]